jgi:DNA-directed RNA polymerase specialized sigma subunit
MMAAPGQTPVQSVEELQPLREAVAECIEQLDEQDRFIVDALNSEMVSLGELGKRLGVSKTHAWRLRNDAYKKLQTVMMDNPVIRERLGLGDDESETLADNGGL